jgi:hypothetical protein
MVLVGDEGHGCTVGIAHVLTTLINPLVVRSRHHD